MSKNTPKQVTIHMGRRLTLHREGKEDVHLKPGANTVDADVAEHEFVKHHMTAAPAVVNNAELEAAQARIAELTEEVQALRAEIEGKDIIIKAFEASSGKK